jgi:hypothetical protein
MLKVGEYTMIANFITFSNQSRQFSWNFFGAIQSSLVENQLLKQGVAVTNQSTNKELQNWLAEAVRKHQEGIPGTFITEILLMSSSGKSTSFTNHVYIYFDFEQWGGS